MVNGYCYLHWWDWETSIPVLLVPLKGSRSMTACPPQEALARLWLEPPPLCSRKFSDSADGWLVGEVSLSPECGCWPSDLKVSAGPRPPEDMLGVLLCHTGGLQKLRSNRRRNHMLVTFWRMSLSMSALLAIAFRSAKPVWTKGGQVIVYFCPSLLILHFFFPQPCL